jgi:hypothetical protein
MVDGLCAIQILQRPSAGGGVGLYASRYGIRRGDDGSEDDVWTMEVNAFLDDRSQSCVSPKVGNV